MNAAEKMLDFIERQDLSKAKEMFEEVKKYSSDEEKYSLAEQLAQYGFLEEAKELYELLLKNYPGESEIKILLSELLIELGREEEVYSLLESIDKNDSNYAAALLLEADLYQMQGLYEVSEHKLLMAKEEAGAEPVIDFALGELYMSLGRFLEAVASYKKLLAGGVESIAEVDINRRLAEALSAGGAFEESLPYYEKAINKQKELDVLFGYGLTSFQAGQYQQGVKAFRELKELDPGYHSLYLYLAKCYNQLGQTEKAIETAIEGLSEDEYQIDLYIYAAGLMLKEGREEEAEEYYRQALALDPESIEAAYHLNKLLLHQERYAEVAEVVSSLSDVEDAHLHWDAAYSYQKLEQYSKALSEYKLAYNELQNNPDFLREYGFFLVEEGRREEGAEVFKRLNKMEPLNPEWLEILERLED